MHRHQVDGIERVDHGVRDIAGEPVDVIRDAGQRREPAVLHAADQPAHFLQVLTRLHQTRPAQLERVGAVGRDLVEQLGRRRPVDRRDPTSRTCP